VTPPWGEGTQDMDKTDTLRRLKNVEGHLRGIERMVAEDAYCIDVIRQISAAQAALSRLSTRVLNEHLRSCLITAVRGEDAGERERVLKEIGEVYELASKV
jgi:DNA-binding FrmR family transcriptional regulator